MSDVLRFARKHLGEKPGIPNLHVVHHAIDPGILEPLQILAGHRLSTNIDLRFVGSGARYLLGEGKVYIRLLLPIGYSADLESAFEEPRTRAQNLISLDYLIKIERDIEAAAKVSGVFLRRVEIAEFALIASGEILAEFDIL